MPRNLSVSNGARLIKKGCNCRNGGLIFVIRRKVYLNYIYYWGSYIYEKRAKSRAVVLLVKSEPRYSSIVVGLCACFSK